MGKVRVGFVGIGFGRFLAKALAANPRGEIAAVCDVAEGQAHGPTR